ncbi:cation:proton antiporter [Actinomadura harenae]|uniref:Sodium:proton antiporter n=1 Tax=Actinomadura harenae TaxID=2483351 RepID=A0A3M2M6F5_9ACTN|nr:cation:proton antiporter [Actinomadura harenae]RMI45092.1 sodium:proton antiporter [Actinomadura harenae]
MASALVAVVGVVSLVAVAASAERLGLAAPLALVVVGGVLGFVPGVPEPVVPPELVLAGVLPPLMYAAAVNMPAADFRRNSKVIFGLAVLLVVATMLLVGWLLNWLIPEIPLPVAFAVGAVVSPTDAVAATSVGRRLGLPARLLTILEGEGLVNDATSLVLLRSAVTAIAASVSVGGVAAEFVYSVVVATLVGWVVGRVVVLVRARLGDPVMGTALSFVVPFVAFLPAEELEASGILAVVVTGLVTGSQAPRVLSAADRLTERTNWRTVAFLLEGGIFLFMGLGLHGLVDEVGRHHLSVGHALLLGLAASAAVILVRIVFLPFLMVTVRRDEQRAERAVPRLREWRSRLEERPDSPRKGQVERRLRRASADVRFTLEDTLGWRAGAVLAWSGMRGAITVAAAQTLPEDTPMRPELILIAFVVAATTLLLQGLTLPGVIRAAKVPPDDPERLRDDYRSLVRELNGRGAEVLDRVERDGSFPPEVIAKVRADERLPSAPPAEPAPDFDRAREQYRELRLRVVEAERTALLDAHRAGSHRSSSLNRARRRLDAEELTLPQPPSSSH